MDNQNARHPLNLSAVGGKTVIMDINAVLKESFKKWLQTLNYADSTIYGSVNYIKDFFFYLEQNGISSLEQISKAVINDYYNHLQTRKNKRQTGSLSQNYITSNINALKRFSTYLQQTGKANLEIDIKTSTKQNRQKLILNKVEIQALYKACGNDPLGIRDKVMLDLYYGCGLRRSEGISLDVKDVLLKQRLIYIKKGKGYKERYVPITGQIKENLETYTGITREDLLNGKKNEALLISSLGKRMSGNAILERLNKLLERSRLNKAVGLHSLRHSIATHLLQSGMALEDVSRFLGHASLESTQIYTHLSAEGGYS
ncbi:tyrosine-type recombinase/integrase [Seonamhaeicola sp.]|uniref:tyrosine-type recombinase/integrase n=1 Tax=Seonamhaeicola sp. TaxID=1912245 RepID=UPI0026248ABE|nr:tyrosine-type recombinase/integrase [Seonamhaeicola sp.]